MGALLDIDGQYRVTKIGRQILLDISFVASGDPWSGYGFYIHSTGCSAIQAAISGAGGGLIDEPSGYVPGIAVAIPDNNYLQRIHGKAVWDLLSNQIYIDLGFWEYTSEINVTVRFTLFSNIDA
jgi:hypothetical protein